MHWAGCRGWSDGGGGVSNSALGMAERHLQVAALIDMNVDVLTVAMATAVSGMTGDGARSIHF